jgi:hypothetical protein
MGSSPWKGGFSFSRKALLHGVRKWEARICEPCSNYNEDKSVMFEQLFSLKCTKTLDRIFICLFNDTISKSALYSTE